MPLPIHRELQTSLDTVDALTHREQNPDIVRRTLRLFRREAAVYFVDGMISGDVLRRFIIEPALRCADTPANGDAAEAIFAVLPLGEIARSADYGDAVRQLMDGKVLLVVDGMDEALLFDVRAYVRRGISPPLTESVVCGPHEGFNESLRDNVTLLRRILRTPQLIGEMCTVGLEAPTAVELLYLQNVADSAVVARVRQRLAGVAADHVLSVGALQQLIEDRPFALLPQCCLTERPDRAASFLLEGQVVLVMDGSPQALCVPVSLYHLLHTPDDTSMRWQTGTFLRLLRYLGVLCTLLLPGLFVASVIFHPEILPVTLLTAVLEAQTAVPLSIPAEMLLMLLMFNLISEAATRVPGVVGSSLGTVSGLILGQAAVEARLIHPLLIIVVAVASLGSYAVPDYSLSLAFRIGQLAFVAIGCIFGVYGIVLFGAAALVRLCAMQSFGSPYLAPVSPPRMHNPDLVLRLPIWRQRLRTWLADPTLEVRTRGRMRRWDGGSHEDRR